MTRVKSSMIKQVFYKPDTFSMRVQFHNGSIYQYENVGKGTYEQLIQADSVGKFFHAQVKGRYDWKRVK